MYYKACMKLYQPKINRYNFIYFAVHLFFGGSWYPYGQTATSDCRYDFTGGGTDKN